MRNPFSGSPGSSDDAPSEIYGYRVYLVALSATWVGATKRNNLLSYEHPANMAYSLSGIRNVWLRLSFYRRNARTSSI